MTGIVCALDSELAPFLAKVEKTGEKKHAMLRFVEGRFAAGNVVAVYSGVGKVNAAIAAQSMADLYPVQAVVMMGVAGAIDPALHIGDVVVATDVAHHDQAGSILTEYHPYAKSAYFPADEGLLQACKKALAGSGTESKVTYGRIVTGEAFIAEDGREAIIEAHGPLGVDMETAAVAQVCHANGLPFIAIRAISDTPAQSGEDVFAENLKVAAQAAADVLGLLLQAL